MKRPTTRFEEMIGEIAKYPEYTVILDTPGMAFHFNEFVKTALWMERLILDYFEEKDIRARRRHKRKRKI